MIRIKATWSLFLLTIVALATSVTAAVPPMINYQGKLMQSNGSPVPDGEYKMSFAIYGQPTGGTALWSEVNEHVQVKGGLYSVLLGSVINLPANIFDIPDRFFGVKVGDDAEMMPRQQVASSAFAFRAACSQTVDDGAVTTSKIAASAVTGEKVASSTLTADKLAPGVAIPPGGVIMWSGELNQIPAGWALCDGSNGTPDLRDRFVVGAGSAYIPGERGGLPQVTLTVDQMPSHRHFAQNSADCGASDTTRAALLSTCWGSKTGWGVEVFPPAGGDQPHENRPPYYALCFIMKLAY